MSDFGSIILFNKKAGEFNTSDQNKIKESLKKVIKENVFPLNITKGNFAELRKWDNDGYCSIITEYYDDEDSEEIWEFAKDDDVAECERIIELLKPDLLTDFDMEAKFEDW